MENLLKHKLEKMLIFDQKILEVAIVLLSKLKTVTLKRKIELKSTFLHFARVKECVIWSFICGLYV